MKQSLLTEIKVKNILGINERLEGYIWSATFHKDAN